MVSTFQKCIFKLLEFEDDNDSDSSSDMSEYGWDNSSDMETKPKGTKKQAKIKRPPSLDKYMDIMDKELAKTEVGKSFEKEETKQKPAESAKVVNLLWEIEHFQGRGGNFVKIVFTSLLERDLLEGVWWAGMQTGCQES